MTASIIYFPAVREGAAGQGRSPAPQPSRGVGDPQPIYKRGREIQVGDQLIVGQEVFLVVAFAGRSRFGRIAINVWGETAAINGRRRRRVLNPPNSAALNQK